MESIIKIRTSPQMQVPFPTYNKSAANNFETIFISKEICTLSINESILINQVEIIVAKIEIAHYEILIHVLQCF